MPEKAIKTGQIKACHAKNIYKNIYKRENLE
jgi:hypothetical protein